MSESKLKFRESLGRYVQVLHDQGVRHVALDRKARESLQRCATSRPVPRTPPLSIPSPAPSAVRRSLAEATEKTPMPRSTPSAPAPVVTSAAATTPSAPVAATGSNQEKLDQLALQVRKVLEAHPLPIFRNNIVFGEGNPEAGILFVGEAPGAEEDKLGRPFVGRAGQTLTKMIQAMGINREDVYIANIVKCRPDMPEGVPGNRKPTPEEMRICLPFVLAQIEIIRPKAIVALGATAVEGLLDSKLSISKLRGRFVDFRGTPLMPTFHPSYLLHNPTNETKRKVWEDLLMVMEKLGMSITPKQRGFFLTPS